MTGARRTDAEPPDRAQPLIGSLDDLQWEVDPTEWALQRSAESTDTRTLPPTFCPDLGRRLLLAQLEFPQWILRRVEKVRFERDWTVTRQVALDISIRRDAPRFRDSSNKEFWVVPLSSMRRRTLVNLDLRDESGTTMTMPGIRLTQQFDQAILTAAAATARPADATEVSDEQVRSFITTVVAGELPEVVKAMRSFSGKDAPVPPGLVPLKQSTLFSAALARLRHNFTLYTFLPVEQGRHRVLWMSFDEPNDWRYRISKLDPISDSGTYSYQAAIRLVPMLELRHIMAALALTPTRVRIQIPGAENAASYHCEVTAPPGLQIVKATLLAGRPNDQNARISTDHMEGYSSTVGLHAIEVPNGSLCRAQFDLRVPTHGWLNTMLVSCVAIFAVLCSVLFHWTMRQLEWSDQQVTNVVLLLVTASGAVATFVAQRESGGIAARVVSGLRALGLVATSLPILAAGFLVYANHISQLAPNDASRVRGAMWVFTSVSFIVILFVLAAWIQSRRGARESMVLESPWDMTADNPTDQEDEDNRCEDYLDAVKYYKFDSTAVAIRSAEGWHLRYVWTDELQKSAVRTLRGMTTVDAPTGRPLVCTSSPSYCTGDAGCPVQRDAADTALR